MSEKLSYVEVMWRDSVQRGIWNTIERHQSMSAVGPIVSVGFLLTKNKDVIQLAQNHSLMNGDVGGVTTIPRENVIKMHVLKKKGGRSPIDTKPARPKAH